VSERLEPERLHEAEVPAAPSLTVDDFEAEAKRRLPQMVFDYYAGGSGDEWTLQENRRAFDRWIIRPRVLVDVSAIQTRTSVLGADIPFPILLAPTAFQRMAHRHGELATAQASKALDAIMVLSTISTVALEEVARTGVRGWFQLYVLKDRDLTAELVKRAHVAGFGALVLTVDTPILGRRLRDERNQFSLPPGIGLANLEGMGLPDSTGSGLFSFFLDRHDASLSWDDVAWLRSLSPLPLVLKGIVTAEDTRLAVQAGVDAVVVSNHGGRQLDGAPATLDALAEVVQAAEGRLEVLLDGGVRRGSDVFKALALGARAVMVGRPYLWGLAVDGAGGVRKVLEILRDDLILTMALAGRARVQDIDRSAVATRA
jgi:isopentenyl diphosphate isomerase/L-lactate dehydrogenase-like FMN-dependent dehydrogenase